MYGITTSVNRTLAIPSLSLSLWSSEAVRGQIVKGMGVGVKGPCLVGPSFVTFSNRLKILSKQIIAFPFSADVSIAEFLTEEIATEKTNLKKVAPIPGFSVATEGAEVTFTKDFGNEK